LILIFEAMQVYYTSINVDFDIAHFNNLLHCSSNEFKLACLKFKHSEDKHRFIASKFLLKKIFDQHFIPFNFSLIKKTVYGKPFLDNFKFNISHSGNYVVLAFNEMSEVGIDIELIENINIADFREMFNEVEFDAIVGSKNSIQTFYEYWTKKESISKAIGKGVSLPFRDIHLNGNIGHLKQDKWFLNELSIDSNYRCFLSSRILLNSVPLIYVPFNSLR